MLTTPSRLLFFFSTIICETSKAERHSSKCPLNRGVRLIRVGTVGGAHRVTSFFIDLVWFYCKTINTVLFDLNKFSSNWLKNKFKKEAFDVLN